MLRQPCSIELHNVQPEILEQRRSILEEMLNCIFSNNNLRILLENQNEAGKM